MSRFTGGDHLKPEDGLKYYTSHDGKRIVGRARRVQNIKCGEGCQRSEFRSYPVRHRRQ